MDGFLNNNNIKEIKETDLSRLERLSQLIRNARVTIEELEMEKQLIG